MIELRNVAMSAGGKPILRSVDVRFERGVFSAILGANGAGKTTLLRGIAGLLPLDDGSIYVDDRDVRTLAPGPRALHIALIAADEPALDGVTVREIVATGRYPHRHWWEWNEHSDDAVAVERALHDVGLTEFAGRPIETLSSGERQRAWIALGLAQETPVLLLDEPTSHLDVRAAHDVLRVLRDLCARGKTIVCVLHDVNEAAAFADTALLLGHGGAIATGPRDEVLTTENLQRTYGIAMEPLQLPHGGVRLFVRE
jgi:ABC-type cobalamin/Fe3+-siderophores transport system ATPase subunit